MMMANSKFIEKPYLFVIRSGILLAAHDQRGIASPVRCKSAGGREDYRAGQSHAFGARPYAGGSLSMFGF